MDMIGKIRRLHARDKLSEREIARKTGLSRNTVSKWLRAPVNEAPKYRRERRPNKLNAFEEMLKQALTADAWAAAGSVDTNLSFSSLLELYGTDVAQCRMPARWVVEALDVIEDIGPCLLATSVHLAGRPLGLH